MPVPESSNTMANDAETASENEPPYAWMIRPCELYKDEYNECTSIKGRFHQYFVFGETIDCKQWKVDYDNCHLWTKYKNDKAYNDIIESEKKRRLQRLKGHYNNDVWQRRDKPPENWNAPLPKWLEERNQTSYLKCVSDQMKKEKSEEAVKSSCTIM